MDRNNALTDPSKIVMKFENVYFINGTAYAGKSTMVKLLAEKYDGIACEENYQDMINFRECLKRVNSQERYMMFQKSGFNVITRDENSSIDETFALAESMFGLNR